MLITFSCKEYENITMFGDIAKRLLKMMGHSATVPGAIVAKDIPEALSRLQEGLAQEKQNNANLTADENDDEPEISLATRAVPLINMLNTAVKKNCNIMWK